MKEPTTILDHVLAIFVGTMLTVLALGILGLGLCLLKIIYILLFETPLS
jgi:hypothetical protein